MGSEQPKRSLTNRELKCLRMLEMWEELVDNKRLFGTFVMSSEALDVCQRLAVAVPQSVTPDRSTGNMSVRFSLPELHRYIRFVCSTCGLAENIEGTVTTHDGVTFPIKFKERPVLYKKASDRK